ncbi:MAG: UDP-3-O-acyl-N-acetylglucosamine deacetylase [Alphaproteobacteria bacterium]|nr:UDP-3-O-acyl-N-acetylglucosamine deacetylase [Alphaproteobacteria bacterium]
MAQNSAFAVSAPHKQHTLAGTIKCQGVAVHSGESVNLRLLPGEPGSGITFIRTDLLNGARTIPARYDNVIDTRLCTVLGNDHGARVATVEHLLSALRALNVDNAVIEIDGPELPIMDGSAYPFVFMIEAAGVVEQNAKRRWIEVMKPVVVEEDGKRAALVPAKDAEFDVSIAFKSTAIGEQSYDFTLSAPSFKNEISRARTFGFREEVDQLRAAGLARGGSLNNAIVVSGDTVMNEEGLRYPQEFARHKLLDAVGDLSLAGAPILGRFEGHCCGHALNNRLLRTLFADESAWRFVTDDSAAALASLPLMQAGA